MDREHLSQQWIARAESFEGLARQHPRTTIRFVAAKGEFRGFGPDGELPKHPNPLISGPVLTHPLLVQLFRGMGSGLGVYGSSAAHTAFEDVAAAAYRVALSCRFGQQVVDRFLDESGTAPGSAWGKWVALVYLLAFEQAVPALTATKCGWVGSSRYLYRAGEHPSTEPTAQLALNTQRRIGGVTKFPETWNQFFADIQPPMFLASAEVCRWLAATCITYLPGGRPPIRATPDFSLVELKGQPFAFTGQARRIIEALFVDTEGPGFGFTLKRLGTKVRSDSSRFRVENAFRGRDDHALATFIERKGEHIFLHAEVARIWRAQSPTARTLRD